MGSQRWLTTAPLQWRVGHLFLCILGDAVCMMVYLILFKGLSGTRRGTREVALWKPLLCLQLDTVSPGQCQGPRAACCPVFLSVVLTGGHSHPFDISMFEYSGTHEEIKDRVFQPLTRSVRSKGNGCCEDLNMKSRRFDVFFLLFSFSYVFILFNLHFPSLLLCLLSVFFILHCFVIRGRNNPQGPCKQFWAKRTTSLLF